MLRLKPFTFGVRTGSHPPRLGLLAAAILLTVVGVMSLTQHAFAATTLFVNPDGVCGGWNDATRGLFPDSVEVNFNVVQTINAIDVYTLKNTPNNGSVVGDTTPATTYGIKNFEVQLWTGASWVTVPGGSVTNNTLAKRRFVFAPTMTDRVRVVVGSSADNTYSRVVEIEAFSCSPL